MSEALPIGNGRLGAMVFGGTPVERIAFNENTLWSGDPTPVERPEAREALARVRGLLFAGRPKDAERLAEEMMTVSGEGFGFYQAFGDLFIEGLPEIQSKYRRTLDLRTGVASTEYHGAQGRHQREVFASHPDQVLVLRIINAGPMSVRLRMATLHERAIVSADSGGLRLVGNNGRLDFQAQAAVETDGSFDPETGAVNGATQLTIFLSAATNYHPLPPDFRTKGLSMDVDAFVEGARSRGWEALRARHIEDHARLYGRSEIELADGGDRPTDERLRDDPADPALAALIFHYGRYLLIASSRAGGLPANLQGLWTDSLTPPWHCDFHLNINLQMNYWPAETTGLSECADPLLNYIDLLRPAGRRTAEIHYGCGGWVVHWASNPWARTTPGWSASWGLFHAAGAWLALHAWERYRFEPDGEYLTGRLLPLLRETCVFYFDFLVSDPESGDWCTAPSVSPENAYWHGGEATFVCRAPAMDIQILRELFQATAIAAEIGGDHELEEKCRGYLARLPVDRVGSDGRLLEWEHEFPEVDPKHRHVSHLFALYPGTSISPEDTPEVAEAARRSLEARGDDGTGWSKAWKICFWARLLDGDRASKLLAEMLTCIEEKEAINYAHGGVYQNLLCAHPPFQIDGNLGATAAIAEMLVQSQRGEIHVLPALPAHWTDGSFRGLRARGGFCLSGLWSGSILRQLTVSSDSGGECRLRLPPGCSPEPRLISLGDNLFLWPSRPGEVLEVSFEEAFESIS